MTNDDAEDQAPNVQYPRSAFVEAVREADDPLGTAEVAERVGCSRELAYKRLRELTDEGEIERRKIGSTNTWRSAE